MPFVDHIFILLLFVVQPVYGVFESRRYEAQARAGQPLNRIRFYRQTALMEWVFLAVLGAAWFIYGRPIADRGFLSPGGREFCRCGYLRSGTASFLKKSAIVLVERSRNSPASRYEP